VQENTSILMSLSVKYYIILTILYGLTTANPLLAQSSMSAKINFNAQNEKLSIILYRLANEANVNFTYDAGDNVFDNTYTYNAINKSPLVILDELLSNTNHEYKQIGNQIVIFKNNSNIKYEDDEIVAVVSSENNESIVHGVIVDTIYIRDSIITVISDTIRIIDTIYIEKQKKKPQPIVKVKDIPTDYFNKVSSREKGWSASVFIAPIVSNISLAQESGAVSFRNFSLGIEASKIFNNWNILGGIKLTQFSEKFNHTYTVNDGGFFVTDTVDTYYTIIQTDTAWYYITDSTWKPIDNHEYSYNISNRIGYIEFSTGASFDYYSTSKIRLYIKAIGQMGILMYRNGLAIPDSNNPEGVDFADLNFSTASYSILLGTGIKYRINKQLDFNSEIYYLNYFTDMVVDYPHNTKVRGVGIKFGLMYYF